MQTKSACIIFLLLLAGVVVQVSAQQRVDKTHDGLKGAVKSVSWEIVRFDLVDGKYAEGNWTKRTVYKGIKEVEDSLFTRAHPWSVEYRVITYY